MQLEKFLKEYSAEIKDDRVKILKSDERQVKTEKKKKKTYLFYFLALSDQETRLPL